MSNEFTVLICLCGYFFRAMGMATKGQRRQVTPKLCAFAYLWQMVNGECESLCFSVFFSVAPWLFTTTGSGCATRAQRC
jgi:hypothetical protein